MATKTQEVQFKLSATDGASSVFARVGRGLDDLKRVAGARGPLKDIGELAIGGGAIAGLTFVTGLIANATTAAGEFAQELSNSDKRAGDLVDGLARKLPLVRQGFQIGEGLGDIVASIGRAVGATESFVDRWSSAGAKIRESQAALKELADLRAAFDDGGKSADLARRANAATLTGIEAKRIEQSSRESADAIAISAMRRRADEDPNLNPEQRDSLRQTADRLQRDADRTAAKERKKLEADDASDRRKQAFESQVRVDQAKAEARRLGLRESGRDLEADRDQIRESQQRAIEDIGQRFIDASRANPERTAALEEQAKKEIDAVNAVAQAQEAAAERQRKNEVYTRNTGVNRDVRQARLDALRGEAAIGSQAKEIELERAQIADSFQTRREQIQQKLREDVRLTAEQRDRYKEILNSLDAQEEKEKRIAGLKQFQIGFARAEESAGITGVDSQFQTGITNLKSRLFNPAAPGAAGAGATGTAPGTGGGAGGAAAGANASGTNIFAKTTAEQSTKQTQLQQQHLDAIRDLAAALRERLAAQPIFPI